MAAKIIHHHEVAPTQHRHEALPHLSQKADPVYPVVEHAGHATGVAPQGGHERHRVAMAVLHTCHWAFALPRTTR
jgi:hypothetical protein